MTVTFDDQTRTVSPEETGDRLGVEESTLGNWRWSGRGPLYVKVGGRFRYRLCDITDWLDQQTRKSTSDPGPGDDR